MSQFSERVKQLDITFDFFHVYCKMQDVNFNELKHPEDLWYISARYDNRVYHNQYTTGSGTRVLAMGVTCERGGYYHKSTGDFYKTTAQLIRANLLVLPTKVVSALGAESTQRTREKLLWDLGCSFLQSSIVDASGAKESFKSWASSFGYGEDSISALKMYLQCQETSDKLAQFFGYDSVDQPSLMNELSQLEH